MITRRAFAFAATAASVCTSAFAQTPPASEFQPEHDQYAVAADLFRDRRWRDLIALIDGLPAQSAVTLIDDLGEALPLADNLNSLARTQGGKGIAGAIQVNWAWRYRGDGMQIVDEDAFGRHLLASADLLLTALNDDRNDGVSAAYLFRVLKGAGESELLRQTLPAFLAASRRPVQGLASYADAVSAKWTGSETECLEFARGHANSISPSSYGVIADAHITCAVARAMSDNPQEAATADAYFTQAAVIEEIVNAHDQFIAAPVDSDRYATWFANAQFSFAFFNMRDEARLRTHLQSQGEYSGGPWRFLPNRRAAVVALRRALRISAT